MADAGDLYDEFGNYIGPELSESEEVRLARRLLPPVARCHHCELLLPVLLLAFASLHNPHAWQLSTYGWCLLAAPPRWRQLDGALLCRRVLPSRMRTARRHLPLCLKI